MKQMIVLLASIALGVALAALVVSFKTPVSSKVDAQKSAIESLSVSCIEYQMPEETPTSFVA